MKVSIYFIGDKQLYLDCDSTILHKLQTEEWVKIGNDYIKTSNITHMSVSNAPDSIEPAPEYENDNSIVQW